MASLHLLEKLGNQVDGTTLGDAEPDAARQQFRARAVDEAVVQFHDGLCFGQQVPALGGEADVPVLALEQAHAELLFQALDAQGHRPLRAAAELGGDGDATLRCDGEKRP